MEDALWQLIIWKEKGVGEERTGHKTEKKGMVIEVYETKRK